jgi:hypothetical protein
MVLHCLATQYDIYRPQKESLFRKEINSGHIFEFETKREFILISPDDHTYAVNLRKNKAKNYSEDLQGWAFETGIINVHPTLENDFLRAIEKKENIQTVAYTKTVNPRLLGQQAIIDRFGEESNKFKGALIANIGGEERIYWIKEEPYVFLEYDDGVMLFMPTNSLIDKRQTQLNDNIVERRDGYKKHKLENVILEAKMM